MDEVMGDGMAVPCGMFAYIIIAQMPYLTLPCYTLITVQLHCNVCKGSRDDTNCELITTGS